MFSEFDMRDSVILGYSLGCCLHYMITDADGDAAVVEYVENELRVVRPADGERLTAANFFLSEDGGRDMPAYDPEGIERDEMMKKALDRSGGIMSFEESFQLLSDIHLNYRHNNNLYDITTLWSSVYNNTALTMSLASRMDYSKIYTFSVTEPMTLLSTDGIVPRMPIEGIGLR